MKEIDFLPEWYRLGKRRKVNLHRQYVALVAVFVAMLIWNFITSHSIAKARDELGRMTETLIETELATQDYERVKEQVIGMQKKAKVLERIDSKIDVANALAEINFLFGEKVVLGNVELVVERFDAEEMVSPGEMGFKVVINGRAQRARDVAELVLKLEQSPCFDGIALLFSKNIRVEAGDSFAGGQREVTEFEINCLLANGQRGKNDVVKSAYSKGGKAAGL